MRGRNPGPSDRLQARKAGPIIREMIAMEPARIVMGALLTETEARIKADFSQLKAGKPG
ncbi:hypothetical protein NTH_03000 [Nitratireductor thuwali]|uniref:Uncharacterized protein n=1 Tax=Nitratireductor thuwali TaxID=2267699 RepID=A0ABY5ML22_9HYPH|nr:hypothetical protein NTH_03000 [Nitratireductor thuwali]